MKKRVIAVLLSAMMITSMAPVSAMASFDDGTEVQVADEFTGADETGDIFAAGEEADADLFDTEEDVFSAEAADAVTINGVSFERDKTYIVPLTLKNAHNLEQDSAAVACPGKFGTLTFDEDGTPRLSTNLRSVTVGTLTDYAYNFKVYQAPKASGETVDADIVATQDVPKADGSGNHEVPETISFAIPQGTFDQNGVYLSMYVDAMGYAPDAYLQIDYADAKESGDPSLNFTTEVSTAEVEQFGNYNVTSQVTVTDGRITAVTLDGNDFKGTHADDNQMYLNKAINGLGSTKGMKDKLVGLYMNDADKLNKLDTVTGATYSSNAIKTATMNALGVKIEQEIIPDAPEEKPEAGFYSIDIKDRTDVVDHGLVGESKKATAYLRVDNDGKMWLTYKMVSGTVGEPLYVLGYNGYYPDNNTEGPLSTEGVTYSTERMTAPTIGENDVVTDITVPLDGVRQTYINNVYLYVEAMKNLNGEVSGVYFDNGKFNINSTITLYWDTLTNLSEDTESDGIAKLADGVYKLNGEMLKVNKVDKSMSNNAINHNIKLTVKNGIPTVSMNFNGMTISSLKGYLKNLYYYETGYDVNKYGDPSGAMSPVNVDSWQQYTDGTRFSDDFGTDYPNDVSFPLCLEALQGEDYIPMQVFVPVMEAITAGSGTQNVYLKLDYSTLTKTTADDKDFAEQETIAKPTPTPAEKKSQTVKAAHTSYSKKYGDKAFSLGAKASTALSYKTSNSKVATVDKYGKVTIKGVGTAKITVTAKETDTYKKAVKTITVKVAKGTPTVTAKVTSKTLKYTSVKKSTQSFSLGAAVNSKGTLSYKKTYGTSAITVNSKTGKIYVKKGLKKGTYRVKIQIKAAARGYYNAGSKTVTVTVKVK
jgi:major membrane immunogen (membrane-anchored lipoprotein)